MTRIGLVTTRDARARNLESLVYRVGEILKQDFEVDLVGLDKASERIVKTFNVQGDGNKEGRARRRNRFLPVLFYAIKYKPDVLLAISSIGTSGLIVAFVGRILGVPSVIRVTSDIFVVYRQKKRIGPRFRLYLKNNVFGRGAIFLANKVIVLHESQIDHLAAYGVNKKKVVAIAQPIIFPETPDRGQAQRVRRSLLGENSNRLVGYIGRLDGDKNIPFLVGVIDDLVGKGVSVVVVGGGDEAGYIQGRYREVELVSVYEEVKRDDLAIFYSAIDVLIQTSPSEGLANVIAEALYFNTPVIATDSGVITRALVSNIVDTPGVMVKKILEDDYVLDQLPTSVKWEETDRRLRELINAVSC